LAPPKTLDMKHDNANVLLHKRINSERISEACHSTSIVDNDTSSLDKYNSTTLESEEIYLKSKNNCIAFNEDQISQQKKISEIIDNITVKNDTSLKSSQYSNHEAENNFDLQNSTELIHVSEEEAHLKSENKFLNGDEFSQDKRILDIVDDIENHKSLNLNLYLSNEKRIRLDSIKLNVSPAKFECNVISKNNTNNSLEHDYKIKSENIVLCNENKIQYDSTLDDYSLSKSVTKLDRITESRTEQVKLLHHQFAWQAASNAHRKTIASCEIEENIEAINPKDATCDIAEKNNPEKNKETCTIISIIPKCDHFNATRKDGTLNNIVKHIIAENVAKFCEKHQNYQSEKSNNARNAKRIRMIRSQSKSDDFEMDILKKQRRYLTLPSQDIAHALNLNFPARNSISSNIVKKSRGQIVMEHCTDHAGNMDIEKSYGELITGACCCTIYFYFNCSFRRFLILSVSCFIEY